MNRSTLDKEVLGSENLLTFQEALRAHTYEAAYAAHEEHIKGSIEPGKLADVAVWSTDPTSATPTQMFNMKPMFMTIVGGKVVYQS